MDDDSCEHSTGRRGSAMERSEQLASRIAIMPRVLPNRDDPNPTDCEDLELLEQTTRLQHQHELRSCADHQKQKGQFRANVRNYYLNDNLERVEISNVQQIADRAFFKRGRSWIDGRLLRKAEFKPNREIRLGSPEYQVLLKKLIARGRQATLSLKGDLLLKVDGEVISVINR